MSATMGMGAKLPGLMQYATGPLVLAASVLCLAAVGLGGCETVTRIPYTQAEQAQAVVPGFPGARLWADDPEIATPRRSVVARTGAQQPIVLALSGGGADGAFG